MILLKTIVQKNYHFLIILFVALFLRTYRLEYLTTFGRDQGIDYLSIRDMLVYHKLTLIGIKVSIADFFQGPVYLYLLAPFFYLLRLNPLAGAYSAVLISLATLSVLYFIVLKMFNQKAAILAAAFFAVSPQLVMFGNTPLYQNFTPLFILLGIWFLYKSRYILSGLAIGVGMELHFLVISLMLSILIYLLWSKKYRSIIFFTTGLLIAATPTILFELRHNFLNIHLLLNYFSSSQQGSSSFLNTWVERLSFFVTHDYNFLIILPLLFSFYIFTSNKFSFSKNYIFLKKLALINLLVIFLFALKLSSFGTHYLLPFLSLLLILIPVYLANIKNQKLIKYVCLAFLGLNLIITVSQLNNNHGYFMPEGWSLKKIEQVSNIISESSSTHPNFNVASLLDGDTRTYPLRYMLSITNQPVQDFTSYPQNDYLYVAANSKEQVINSNVWEINSFKPYKIEQKWLMGDGITLYLLARNK